MGKLDGKVALISGGSRGQGEAQARLFAREGAAVVIGDVLEQGRSAAGREHYRCGRSSGISAPQCDR